MLHLLIGLGCGEGNHGGQLAEAMTGRVPGDTVVLGRTRFTVVGLVRDTMSKARQQIGLFLGILLTVSVVVIALIIHVMTLEKLKQITTLN